MKYSLKAHRVNNKMTQEEVAQKLGISVSALINYENGKTFPNVPIINKFENLYGITYDDIDFLYPQNTVKQ